MLVVALVFMLAGRVRSPRSSENAAATRKCTRGEISHLIAHSVSASKTTRLRGHG
jgi:hypothetical protein